MIYPIVAYGDPVLRKVARDIEPGSIDIQKLAEDMFETMYAASGVGLAGPQIGLDLRIFVVDGTPMFDAEDEEPELTVRDFKKVFINAYILEETGEKWPFEEGCLSIPGVRADVYRPEKVTIRYQDVHFQDVTETYEGLAARIIQHEYDHIEGILFTDKISMLKKTLIKKKLQNIMDGKARPDYRMKFANKKGR